MRIALLAATLTACAPAVQIAGGMRGKPIEVPDLSVPPCGLIVQPMSMESACARVTLRLMPDGTVRWINYDAKPEQAK